MIFDDVLTALEAGLQPGGSGERLVLATGRYLGEGFDDSRLDTLFLVIPISWTGTLAQYVGRLHRDHDGKREGYRVRLRRPGRARARTNGREAREGLQSLGIRPLLATIKSITYPQSAYGPHASARARHHRQSNRIDAKAAGPILR